MVAEPFVSTVGRKVPPRPTRSSTVRTFRYVALAAFAALLLATSAFAAPKKSIPISGKYSGTATTKNDGGTVTIAANGVGKASQLGAGKLTGNGSGDSSQ